MIVTINFTFVINGLNQTGKQMVIRYVLRRGTSQVFIGAEASSAAAAAASSSAIQSSYSLMVPASCSKAVLRKGDGDPFCPFSAPYYPIRIIDVNKLSVTESLRSSGGNGGRLTRKAGLWYNPRRPERLV